MSARQRREIIERVQKAEELGVTVQGAYVNSNEHRFFFVLEADDYAAVARLLGPPLLQDHIADIVPVLTWEEIMAALAD